MHHVYLEMKNRTKKRIPLNFCAPLINFFLLGHSKLILCFASQGKKLDPQPGLFLFIKFTRQAIYDVQNYY